MIRGFGRNEHGLRRLEDLDSEDNEVDETMVSSNAHSYYCMPVCVPMSFLCMYTVTKFVWTRH